MFMKARAFWGRILAVVTLAVITACSDTPTQPPQQLDDNTFGFNPNGQNSGRPSAGIGILGRLEEVRGSSLVLRQQALDFKPDPSMKDARGWHELPIGTAGEQLVVLIEEDTRVVLGGQDVVLNALQPGTLLIALGTPHDGNLKATLVSDLAQPRQPPADLRPLVGDNPDPSRSSHPRIAPFSPPRVLSLCMGQDFDHGGSVDEFQGCWGGPTVADDLNIPDVPLFCPLVGCFMVDRLSYTLALGGWNFAFPFQFNATAPALVYHVPGSVNLGLQALDATAGAFTFVGGLGIDFGLNIDFCSLPGCYDVGTYHVSALSTIHQATSKAPFTGQILRIDEVSCPSIGLLTIVDVPIDPLALGLCEDLSFKGKPFTTMVRAERTQPYASRLVTFDGPAQTIQVRPNASSLRVVYDDFEYIPDLAMGFYFRLKSFGVTLVESPSIPIADGPFHAVTTPFPMSGSVFTVATEPYSSPANYLYQPAEREFTVEVQPAPTRLAIISSQTLAEGTPVRARLQEEYDGSPIAGRLVTFTADGEGRVVNVGGVTDAQGVARAILPGGEYAVTATFGGSDVYLPSTAHQEPVFVYLPTSFVIWGGNAGGVQAGQTYLFWGSQWWKAITGGDFQGNASFKGYAVPINQVTWMSPPGNAVRPPATLPPLIGVIVSTSIRGNGQHATGNIAGVVVLRVQNPGSYQPDPGHAAYGVMKMPLMPEPNGER